MTTFSLPEIERRRSALYFPPKARRVRDISAARRFIRRVGFCWLFASTCGVPELPSLFEAVKGRRGATIDEWDADSDLVWGWKNELPARRQAYYGKALIGRPAFVSLDMLPYLLAARGHLALDLGRLYARGGLSLEARRIFEALERNGPTPTIALRSAAGIVGKGGVARFHRGLDELARLLLITPVGATKEVGSWPSQIYELVERWFPEQVKRSKELDLDEARSGLVRRYLKTVMAARPAALARLFGLEGDQIDSLVVRLQAGRFLRIEGEWLVTTHS